MKRSLIAVAATLAVVALAGFVSPAFGGPGFLTPQQAKTIFVTKKAAKKLLSKSAAGSTYLTKSAAASLVSKSEAESKFLPSSAPSTLQVSPSSWVAASGGGTVSYFTNQVNLNKSASGEAFFDAGMTVPSVLQGRPVRITSFELCYEASATAALEKVLLRVGSENVVEDNTKRTDNTCRTYTPASPVTIGSSLVQVVVKVAYTAASDADVSRLSVNLAD
ncbi:MAG TPA: hypothetical protein VMT37_06865 [Solirubrobacterales bacterium]|nr:hypothetical protein [Solirubrobacterales bacterium]